MDSPWLKCLFFAAGVVPRRRLSPLQMILDEAQMLAWHRAKDTVLAKHADARHRASFDAFVIQERYWRRRNSR